MASNTKNCGNCKFWLKDSEESCSLVPPPAGYPVGVCRRNPPTWLKDFGYEFPRTYMGIWCGEHKDTQ